MRLAANLVCLLIWLFIPSQWRSPQMSSLFRTILACGGLLLLLAAPASAAPMHINAGDGSLADWGVTLNGSDHLVFGFTHTGTSGTGTYNGFSFNYFIEDQDDGVNGTGHFLGPHGGGQDYDAEFMGTGIDNGYLVIAIATGQRSDNGPSYFAPGDVMITTTNGTFGVEVNGASYTLNSNGYTISPNTQPAPHAAGSVWEGATWSQSPTTPHTDTQMISGGTHAGDAETLLYSFLAEQSTCLY